MSTLRLVANDIVGSLNVLAFFMAASVRRESIDRRSVDQRDRFDQGATIVRDDALRFRRSLAALAPFAPFGD